MTGGRSSEGRKDGRVGGGKRNTPCTTTLCITTSDIHTEYNVMHCHNDEICMLYLLNVKLRHHIAVEIYRTIRDHLHSTFGASRIPPELHLATTAALSAAICAICVLPRQLAVRHLYSLHDIQPAQNNLHSLVHTNNRSLRRHRELKTEDVTFRPYDVMS